MAAHYVTDVLASLAASVFERITDHVVAQVHNWQRWSLPAR